MLFFRREPTDSPPPDGLPPPPAYRVLPPGAAPSFEPAPIEPVRQPRTWRWWAPRALAGLLALFVLLVAWLALTAPLSKSLQPIAPPQLTLLAADGTPIARMGANVDRPVEAARLPEHVIEPFLAVEDRDFYSHWGISPRGIVRAAWGNLTSSRTQGGSTITQQLAKFTFLSPEQSLGRKLREALIAFWLEAWLSKDEILERYLSNAYFGDNAYGLRAASLHYFYRQPERLTPSQAAMLAGLVKAPSRLAPTKNFRLAEKRMRVVLGAMVDAGYLTPREAGAMRAPALDVRDATEIPTGTYFADWALPEARRQSDVGYARQTLTTTLDSRLQNAARRAVANAGLGKAQVALVAMRPTGEVVAMVGGRDYAKSTFNRATQARRQPGSTFKLFVYLAALRRGWSPSDTIANTPIEQGSYRPHNAGDAYSPRLTLAEAFARSSNVAAVRLMGEVGSEAVIKTARDLGVAAPLPQGDPSLALGTSGMTLLELTAAYAGVAGERNPVAPTAFKAADEDWFGWLLNRRRSLSGAQREAMEEMLRGAVERGTGRAARLGVPAYGKTGTTQDHRDALFVGFAGDLVVGVWVGNDDNTPLKGITGGGAPARIWRDFMRAALGERAAPPRRARPDPRGPVEPLDVPDPTDIPPGEVGPIRLEEGEAVLSTEIGGRPLDVRIGEDGVRVDDGRSADQVARDREAWQRVQEQARQSLREARERAEEAQRRFEDEAQR